MKAITLTQPWASLVALQHKRYETRSWRTFHRGPLAIHAAKGWEYDDRKFAMEEHEAGRLPDIYQLPLGAIVAVVEMAGCGRTEDIEDAMSELELRLGNFGFGRYAWKFASNVWVPDEPIPYRGAQGLWDFPDALLKGYSR